MSKKAIIPLAMIVLFLAGFSFARTAEQIPANANANAQLKKAEVKAEFEALKERLEAKKCAIVEKQVKNRIARFDNRQLVHQASYEKARTLMEGKIEKLETKGYDVKKLTDDLAGYEKLLQTFRDDYALYVQTMAQVQTAACGDTEGSLRSSLADARAQLKVVYKDAVAIRTFWAKTMRPDFLALKTQDATTDETTPDGTSTDSTDTSDTSTSPDTTTSNQTTNESGE